MNEIWFIVGFLLLFPALILFAGIYKYMEISKAARWPSTQGVVIASGTEGREVKSGGPDQDDTELRTFALIVYEFTVGGRKYQGSRVSIGEDMGNFEVAETLAKYPKGKAVTVFYNPRKPAEAVLERDLPSWIWKALIIIVAVLVALIFGGWFGISKLGDLMATLVRNPGQAPFVTACIVFALLAALGIFAIQRNAARQRSWPTVRGKVERSGVHEFQELQRRDSGPDVYRTAYRGATAASGARVSSNVQAIARKRAEKYPVGAEVDVHYNPDNPAESVIKPGGRALLLLWLIPAAMVTLAYFAGR
jgi:hypothetical protein